MSARPVLEVVADDVVEIELLQDAAPRPVPPVLVLAWQEGRRMLLHPATLIGLVWGTVVTFLLADNGTRDAFEAVTSAVTFFVGVPAYFAANLVASRDRRASSGELLAAAPVPERTRVTALCLGALVPAAGVLAWVVVGFSVIQALGLFAPEPGPWHLVTGPATVLGGALLGIMVARWAPVPGAAALVMIAMVAWNVVWSNRPEHYGPLGTYVTWAQWGQGPDWAGYMPGSASLHTAYLLGLCAMAAVGAHLPGARRPWLVLLCGGALTAMTVALGAAQLT